MKKHLTYVLASVAATYGFHIAAAAQVSAAAVSGVITINITGTFSPSITYPPNGSGRCGVHAEVVSTDTGALTVNKLAVLNASPTYENEQTLTITSSTAFTCTVKIAYSIPNTTGKALNITYNLDQNENSTWREQWDIPVAYVTTFASTIFSPTYNITTTF